MKVDNQHLEFLISQYVDGSLEGANKKTVEQRLLNDPAARELYTEHRDTQDLLDDWGNRIPLIHWDDFDQKLAARLDKETVGGGHATAFRRWLRPLSAAAALFIAASLGYAWHAFSHNTTVAPAHAIARTDPSTPRTMFRLLDGAASATPSSVHFNVDDAVGLGTATGSASGSYATITPPQDAVEALQETVKIGLGPLSESVKPPVPTSAVTVAIPTTQKAGKEKDGLPIYP